MRLDPKEIRIGLDELGTLAQKARILPAAEIIRDTKDYIRQLEGDLRRAGFTDYNDTERDLDE